MKAPNTSKVVLAALIAGLLALLPTVIFAVGAKPAVTDEPMEITWQLKEKTTYGAQVAEETFNVKILGNGIWNNDQEKIDLMFASGETPEVFTAGDDMQHYRDGLTREIPLNMVKKYAPLHFKWLNDNPIAFKISKSPDNPDNFIGLDGVAVTTDWPLLGGQWTTRADWAEKLGQPIPGYKEKRWKVSVETERTWFCPVDLTLDWIEDLLVKLRDGDPDGNGKNDTIPISACNNVTWSWGTLFGAFGLPMMGIEVGAGGVANYEEDGKMVLQPISPRYKKFLQHLAGWYADGFIDKEFPTLTIQKMWEKDLAEMTGVQFVSNSTYVSKDGAVPPNHISLDQVEQGASIAMMPPPIGPEGYQGAQPYRAVTSISNWNSLKVRHDVSDEKLAIILEIWDWRQHGEGWFVCQFGKENVHYTWSGEPWKSKPVRRKEEDVEKMFPDEPKRPYFPFYPYGYFPDNVKWVYSPSAVRIFENWYANGKWEYYRTRPYRWDQFAETNLKEISERSGEDLNTIANEFYYRAITGQIDINAEWDSYVNKWLSAGGTEYGEALSKATLVGPLVEGRFEY